MDYKGESYIKTDSVKRFDKNGLLVTGNKYYYYKNNEILGINKINISLLAKAGVEFKKLLF